MSNGNITIEFGPKNFANYRRLSYKWWYAIAEFVDNSTQSFFGNREILDPVFSEEGEQLTINIVRGDDFLRISDNALGMDRHDLERALVVGEPPADISGRSRYGMGMKTAACWIGNSWTITTSKLGSSERLTVNVDVDRVASGEVSMPITTEEEDPGKHYTRIEIRDHNRPLAGRTIGKVKQYLSSMYRQDIRSEEINILYDNSPLVWTEFHEDDFLRRQDNSRYREEFEFVVDSHNGPKTITGWVGVLRNGSRSKAGFSVLHRNRVIMGYPDSWRPEAIFGSGGRNDLVNQRLVGEIHLEEFEVSHTKDSINWYYDDEERVENALKDAIDAHISAARRMRGGTLEQGPRAAQVDAATRTLEEELASPEFLDTLSLEDMLPDEGTIRVANEGVVASAASHEPSFTAQLDTQVVKCFLDSHLSSNDPYFVNESVSNNETIVVINTQHPHWQMLEGENAILNYMRHCVYDAIAEDRASRLHRLNSDTVKLMKDRYLRVPFSINQSAETQEEPLE
jgi:hypothetical protein